MVFAWSILVSIVTSLMRTRDRRERLGFVAPLPPAPRRIVIHAVSAGEAAAARPLVAELIARRWAVVMTYGNRAARAVEERIAGVERVLPLPWDTPSAVRRFLRAVKPDIVATVETEIWPNLFLLSPRVVIVNARMYPRDKYWMLRRFFARVLSRTLVLAISEEEAQRFRAFTSNVEVLGNLKLESGPPGPQSPGLRPGDSNGPGDDARSVRAGGPLSFLAVSTHPGEEEVIAAALPQGARLIIAPRDVRRASKLRRKFANVIDTYGQLDTLYPEADVAIIGGSFVPKGGHNPVEAARHGCAVIIGPHIENVRDLVDALGDRVTVTNDLPGALSAAKRQEPFVMNGIARRYADRIESLV